MSYDGIVTRALAKELNSELKLGKIEKIYQPQPEQLLLSIHTRSGRKLLFLSASGNHPAAYMVTEMTENPLTPPSFCMAMRKHLNAARITEISQSGSDRIINIDMETLDEMGFSVNRRLVVEIMGKHSNILLIDTGKNRIVDSIKHISYDSSRVRQILPGLEYTMPPVQDKIPFDLVSASDIKAMVSGTMQPERSLLSGIQGISPVIAQCIASAGFAGDQQTGAEFDAEAALGELKRIIGSTDPGSCSPTVYRDKDGKPMDFHVTPLSVYESDSGLSPTAFESVSSACEYFYSHRASTNIVKQKSGDLIRLLKNMEDKLSLKLQRLNEDMLKAEDSDKYRLFGELLTANIHMVPPGASTIKVTSYYDGSDVEIPLDPRFSPSRNAQNYYKKYSKCKTAVKEKAVQISETEKDLDYIRSTVAFAEQASTLEEVDLIRQELIDGGLIRYRSSRKKPAGGKKKPSPYEYTLPSGIKVLAGRNNVENDWLTTKRAGGSDIWLHTKDIPGSHVIILLEGKKASDEDLAQAAAIAAYHSKGRQSSNVPVDYTQIRHVKKPSGAKPGMVIFTHNKTLYVDPKIPEE